MTLQEKGEREENHGRKYHNDTAEEKVEGGVKSNCLEIKIFNNTKIMLRFVTGHYTIFTTISSKVVCTIHP